MADDTIDVRDNTSGSSKSVRTSSLTGVHTPHHIVAAALPTDMVNGTVALFDTTTHVLIVAPANSPDLSYRNYIKSVQVANKGATAALIVLKDGSPSSPDVGLAFIYVPAGTTIPVVYEVPLICTAGNALEVAADASSTIYVSAQGYVAP